MAGLLTQREIDGMRHTAGDMLPSSCTIQTRTTAADAQGGITATWANSYTNVPCKFSVLQMKEPGFAGAQWHVTTGWVLSIHHDQPIAVGNRVVFGGDTYEVVGVDDDHDWRVLRRVQLRRAD